MTKTTKERELKPADRKNKTLCDAFEPANATVTADSAATRWHDLEVKKLGKKQKDRKCSK